MTEKAEEEMWTLTQQRQTDVDEEEDRVLGVFVTIG